MGIIAELPSVKGLQLSQALVTLGRGSPGLVCLSLEAPRGEAWAAGGGRWGAGSLGVWAEVPETLGWGWAWPPCWWPSIFEAWGEA